MTTSSKPKVYWYRSAPLPNLGDELSPIIFQRLFDVEVEHSPSIDDAEVSCVGSNLNQVYGRPESKLRTKSLGILGSGFMHPYIRVPRLDYTSVYSVRGYLSKSLLPTGLDPEVGDPGLLVNLTVKDKRLNTTPQHKLGIIPHVSQLNDKRFKEIQAKVPRSTIIDFRTADLDSTVAEMRDCEIIVSQSLHGLVLADSLGIPNVWLYEDEIHMGGPFKYYDYFSSIGRPFFAKVDFHRAADLTAIGKNVFELDRQVLAQVQTSIMRAFETFMNDFKEKNAPSAFAIIRDERTSSESFGIEREAPRPPELRQESYSEAFDWNTLWFCAFNTDDHIRLEGPPLLNLRERLFEAEWRLDGKLLEPSQIELQDRGHAQDSRIHATGQELKISLGNASVTVQVGESYLEWFANRNLIYTKSKNNDLKWIKDWAAFYHAYHNVDAVLIFDNGSIEYTPEQLLQALKEVKGIEVAVVVSWPFKFGPQAGSSGRFDSDYFEYVVSSCAQHRYLQNANVVTHCDIDELVMTDDARPIEDHLAESRAGSLRYRGRLIVGKYVKDPQEGEIPSFENYGYFDPTADLQTPKWSCMPKRVGPDVQWRTHAIDGMPTAIYERVVHRHFYAISTSWKFNRTAISSGDEKSLTIDSALVQAVGQEINSDSN